MSAVVHVRLPSGVAACGSPAKQDQLKPWGSEITCETCQRLYGMRGKA